MCLSWLLIKPFLQNNDNVVFNQIGEKISFYLTNKFNDSWLLITVCAGVIRESIEREMYAFYKGIHREVIVQNANRERLLLSLFFALRLLFMPLTVFVDGTPSGCLAIDFTHDILLLSVAAVTNNRRIAFRVLSRCIKQIAVLRINFSLMWNQLCN